MALVFPFPLLGDVVCEVLPIIRELTTAELLLSPGGAAKRTASRCTLPSSPGLIPVLKGVENAGFFTEPPLTTRRGVTPNVFLGGDMAIGRTGVDGGERRTGVAGMMCSLARVGFNGDAT